MKKSKVFLFLLIFSLFLTCYSNLNNDHSSETSINSIKFYVANDDVSDFIIINKDMPDLNLVKIVKEIKNLNGSTIFGDTKILGVKLIDETAYVDLSEEFNDPNTNSSAIAILKINSIVNTLCLNPQLEIKKVRFLINGENINNIGPIDTSTTKFPNELKNKNNY